MSKTGAYRIRPAGRHLLTIGRDLIKDGYAAVIELVKNAYDADSPCVNISFLAKEDRSGYIIKIQDYGHGMTRDTVINKWMVPSTRDKLERKISPQGRVMQGRKGVGRYAASVLGDNLLLETVSNSGEETTLFVEWDSFEDAEYLEDVEVLIESQNTNKKNGTLLTIEGDSEYLQQWNKNQFDKLRFELKKLIPPTIDIFETEQDFKIKLIVTGFEGVPEIDEIVEPYPIFELFDYKVSGFINANGAGELIYSTQKAINSVDEKIIFQLGNPTRCGDLEFDIRVYDREPESIDALIGRGLKDEFGNYVGKLQAKQILNESNGIGVYRHGFRIRPIGDPDFDWLRLNEQRVQNPSMRIGSNQVIGFVRIQAEEYSNLIEKSARDGLQENNSYEQLKKITKQIIGKLEERRFSYRRKAGLSKSTVKLEKELERVFSFERLKKDIYKKIVKNGISEGVAAEVVALIAVEEKEKNEAVENIRQTVATYQGQATLGKIINVVLHEGRRPLSFFRNEVPRIARFKKRLEETNDKKNIEEILNITDGVELNAANLSELFGRLDPLASGKRPKRKELLLKKEIFKVFSIFRQEMEDNQISFEIFGDEKLTFLSQVQDIHAVFANLIDNSIFWLKEKSIKGKITVKIESEADRLLFIDYKDTGPGIESNLIADGVIFEPQFSTKPSGTGIGLAIAGEAAQRIRLDLKALESATGAYFRLEVKDDGNDN